jgi:hypothetical protein
MALVSQDVGDRDEDQPRTERTGRSAMNIAAIIEQTAITRMVTSSRRRPRLDGLAGGALESVHSPETTRPAHAVEVVSRLAFGRGDVNLSELVPALVGIGTA